MQIGKYKLSIIESGFFGLDGGAMFGIIPKALWQRTNPADASNRIKISTRHLILESESKKIIIDTGMGNKWDDKMKSIYDVDERFSMNSELAKINLSAEDITDLIEGKMLSTPPEEYSRNLSFWNTPNPGQPWMYPVI